MFLLIGDKHELYSIHCIVHCWLNPSPGYVPTFSVSKMKSVLKVSKPLESLRIPACIPRYPAMKFVSYCKIGGGL